MEFRRVLFRSTIVGWPGGGVGRHRSRFSEAESDAEGYMPAWNRISFRVIWRVVRGICRCYRYRSKVEADERITNDAQEGDPGKGHDLCRPGTRKRARYPGVDRKSTRLNSSH